MEVSLNLKQTDAGRIPADWQTGTIGDLMRLINGRAFKPGDWKEQGLPIIRIQNLNNPEAPFNHCSDVVEERHRVEAGTLLFAWSGTKGTSFGARIWNGPTGVLNQHIFKVLPNQTKLIPAYSFLVLRKVQESIEKQAHGFKASFVHVKKSDLVGVPLPFPPNKVEQETIAEALSDADVLIESLEQLLVKKRQTKQGAMQELLTGKKRLPGFSGEWRSQTIEGLEKAKLLRLARGKVISKKVIRKTPGDYPIYSSSVTGTGTFGYYGDHMFDEELITWSVDGGGDFFHRPKHRFSVTNVCGFMQVDHQKLCCRFIAAQLQLLHSRQTYNYLIKAHPSVIRKAYELKLPSFPEQTAIADVLSDMDADIAALEAKLGKDRDLKQGMMQELLTGRIRLI